MKSIFKTGGLCIFLEGEKCPAFFFAKVTKQSKSVNFTHKPHFHE